MARFRLTQPELIVLARMVLGLPLPPILFPGDAAQGEPVGEVAQKALEGLQTKGWIRRQEGGWWVEPELAALLQAAGYLERWAVVMVHFQGKPPYQVGFYHDGQQGVRHEMEPETQTHLFEPGPEDMGYAWLWDMVMRHAAPGSEPQAPGVWRVPLEAWEQATALRLQGAASREAGDAQAPSGDVLDVVLRAELWLQVQCLYSVYTGDRESVAFLLGPDVNWMCSLAPCPEGTHRDGRQLCLLGRRMSLAALRRTLYALWAGFREPALHPESGGAEV